MLVFKREDEIEEIRLAEIAVADTLIDRIGEYITVDQQHIAVRHVKSPERLESIESKPQRHALAYRIGTHAVAPCQKRADFASEKTVVYRKGQHFDAQPACIERRSETVHLCAFAGSVNAFKCDHIRHMRQPFKIRSIARTVFSRVAKAVIRK